MAGKRVGVLMGGISSEREISLKSGRAMLEALLARDVAAFGIDLNEDWVGQLRETDMDVAVIALHGRWGEDGCVQGLLEILQIPYTGSGVMASALCMHKRLCKAILEKAGIKTPVDILIMEDGPIRYPVIVKPVAEGSSVGLHMLERADDWRALSIDDAGEWMAEMPVKGVEVAVSVLNGKALPPVEVSPKSGVYDFDAKYTHGATDYFCPARLPAETLRLCMQRAEQSVIVSECLGAPRVDMIVADGGEPVVLEVNTVPGMTETSLLPKAARAAGIDFPDLCLHMLNAARLDAPKLNVVGAAP
ncbi:MAG: D-alanine--D-alanine ligase [Mariprofundaceae bacterium]|nr:D-alanine--D-alanine ligase [Mariprofundaceae bacterium]